MNSLGYLIAALLLAIYGGRLLNDARAAAGTWAGLAKSTASFLATNNGWLKIAAAFLAGVVTCYVVSHGVSLPNIDWPNVVKPDVVPKPAAELRVLVIEEQADRTGAINTTLNAGTVRDYLASKGKDNYLRLDDESRLELMPDWVRTAAQQRGTTPTPCVVILAGGKHYVAPLPTSPDAFLALLRKYGG